MRVVALIVLFLLCRNAASDDAGYALIDAVRIASGYTQPKWIALVDVNSERVVHVPTEKGIVKLPAGVYQILHVDFGVTVEQEYPNRQKPNDEGKSFVVASEEVVYVGLIELRQRGDIFMTGGYELFVMKVVASGALVGWACSSEPEVMKRLPIRVEDKDTGTKLIRVRCET
jgi:hypothetical protein